MQACCEFVLFHYSITKEVASLVKLKLGIKRKLLAAEQCLFASVIFCNENTEPFSKKEGKGPSFIAIQVQSNLH